MLLTVYFNLCRRRSFCPQSVPKCHVSVARTAYPLQQVSITHHHLNCYVEGGTTRGQHSGLWKRSIQQYSSTFSLECFGVVFVYCSHFSWGFFFCIFTQFFCDEQQSQNRSQSRSLRSNDDGTCFTLVAHSFVFFSITKR